MNHIFQLFLSVGWLDLSRESLVNSRRCWSLTPFNIRLLNHRRFVLRHPAGRHGWNISPPPGWNIQETLWQNRWLWYTPLFSIVAVITSSHMKRWKFISRGSQDCIGSRLRAYDFFFPNSALSIIISWSNRFCNFESRRKFHSHS